MIKAGKVKVLTDNPRTCPTVVPLLTEWEEFAGGWKNLRSGHLNRVLKSLRDRAKSVGCKAETGMQAPPPPADFKLYRESDAPRGLDLMRCDEWGPVEPKK